MRSLITLSLILVLFILCPFASEAWGMDGPPPGAAATAAQPLAPTAPAAPVPTADQPPGKKDEDEPPQASEQVPKPSLGRIVLARFKNKSGDLVTRPGIVVQVFDKTKDQSGLGLPLINLQVFTDGANDGVGGPDGIKWLTSLSYSKDAKDMTWSWMPYQLGQAAKTEETAGAVKKHVMDQMAKVMEIVDQHNVHLHNHDEALAKLSEPAQADEPNHQYGHRISKLEKAVADAGYPVKP